jgi:hypothetical protein
MQVKTFAEHQAELDRKVEVRDLKNYVFSAIFQLDMIATGSVTDMYTLLCRT